MLLSMYASYLWANRSKKTYVLRITVFILLSSFFSAYIPGGSAYFLFFIFFWHPFYYASVLSFPFYLLKHEMNFHHLYYENSFHSIHFLTVNITSTPASGSPGFNQQLLLDFSFFLSVNLVGALLGYLIAKKYRIQFFNNKWGIISCLSTAIACLAGSLLSGLIFREIVGVTLLGAGIFLLDIILFKTLVLPITRAFAQTLREITKRQKNGGFAGDISMTADKCGFTGP